MRPIKVISEIFYAYKISEIGTLNFHALVTDAVLNSNKISTDALFEIDESPIYITHIPYSSGFIEERVVYYNTKDVSNYILNETRKDEGLELFFSKNFVWDFYSETILVLSINMVQNIVTVNSKAIDLLDYEDILEPNED